MIRCCPTGSRIWAATGGACRCGSATSTIRSRPRTSSWTSWTGGAVSWNSAGKNMGVRITVATRMLDPEEVTRSIAMPLQGDALDGLRGDFNRNVRRRLAGRSPRSD